MVCWVALLAYFPEGVDACGQDAAEDARDGEDIEEHEDDGQAHGAEEDDEARADAQDLEDLEIVARFDVPEEIDGGEDPPGVTDEVSWCALGAYTYVLSLLLTRQREGGGKIYIYRKMASNGRVCRKSLLKLLK